MAFPNFTRRDPVPEIPRFGLISEEPALQPVEATLNELRALHLRMSREVEILDLEARFAHRPPTGNSERDQLLAARLALLQKQTPPAAQQTATQGGQTQAVATALALADNSAPVPVTDKTARRADLARRLELVDLALREQEILADTIRADLSRSKSQEVQEQHNTLAVAMFKAAQAFARATSAERQLRAELLRGGYTIAPDLISPPTLSAALVLGTEDQHDSQISTVRRHLEAKGII